MWNHARLYARSRTLQLRADRVEPTIDVHHLTGRCREQVGEQGDAGAGDWFRVLHVPTERRACGPHGLELIEARNALGRDRAERARGHEVDADALGAEVTRE